MRISEIARNRPELEKRRVGITVDNIHRMEYGIRILETSGIDCTAEETTIFVEVPRAAAQWAQGAIERATGTPAYNDWDEPIKRRATYE